MDPGAAQRVHPEPDARAADCLHVDHQHFRLGRLSGKGTAFHAVLALGEDPHRPGHSVTCYPASFEARGEAVTIGISSWKEKCADLIY